MYKRKLNLKKISEKSNLFLFGPRATGKTSLIKQTFKEAVVVDLLDYDVYERLSRRPKQLSELIDFKSDLIVIDEIQKLPILLDEVHRLIEEKKNRFILTGSSVRKLKRDGANLLGGRAREAHLFPLSYSEINDFELLKYLNVGGLPLVYKSEDPYLDLRSYSRTYLAEEIKAEALVRNYDRFVRFLETMALSNTQELNYQNLASDSSVPARTIEGYIEVLKDTLLGFELMPYSKTVKRKATTKSKFYFFDCGVANFLAERFDLNEKSSDIGHSFEQFIINEIRMYLSYSQSLKKMSYWRSKKYEVDLIIGDELGIEIKFSKVVKDDFFEGIHALNEEKKVKKFILVGRFANNGQIEKNIEYMDYAYFLDLLWSGKLV
jgi:predicted AAA+ superfamily ATPase